MRRSLAPYAITATLVVVVSIAVLAGALATGGLLEERVVADASPAPTATRAPVELSRAGRITYWRTDPSGGNQLWVANIDGSQRRAIAKTDALSGVTATRWSPDGESIGKAAHLGPCRAMAHHAKSAGIRRNRATDGRGVTAGQVDAIAQPGRHGRLGSDLGQRGVGMRR